MQEQNRIQFLLQRDGLPATIAWVDRTLRIYRAAVLDQHHFASTNGFRRGFVESYCEFKRWLSTVRGHEHSSGTA